MKLALVLTSLSVLAASDGAQQSRSIVERVEPTSQIRFVGTVVTPAGRPARGAVVESSAGGEAVTGPDGSFELVADVPLDAREVDVTASMHGGKRGSLTASTRVLPASLAPLTIVGTLVVAPGTGARARWRPTFGGLMGVNGTVLAMTTFDDGDGPALYVGGAFTVAGGLEVANVARWDGRRWSALGDGLSGGGSDPVQSLVVFDDGTGPALYASGAFVLSGAASVSRVARWDGASWGSVGGGTDETVRALAVFDDGNGPALYATGGFTSAGGLPVNGVARWDGATWSALGSGLTGGGGRALAVFDDGSGDALYVGGGFTTAGGAPANRIARWDGSTWQALGSGVDSTIYALASFDAGSGAALYAGGLFDVAGGSPADEIARWNGTSWSALGRGMSGGRLQTSVRSLLVFDSGSGASLYVGGDFSGAGREAAHGAARWDGATWAGVGNGAADAFEVDAFAAFDRGDGPELHAGGFFSNAGSEVPRSIARLDGAQWATLGRGPGDSVNVLLPVDLGGTRQLYVGGRFTAMGGVPASRIARWDGSTWSALGSGISAMGATFPSVDALALYDDGGGEDLYAGGTFDVAGGVSANGIARWDGAQWTAVEGTVIASHGTVNALLVFDDGTGPALYAGGTGVAASRWNGSSWTTISFGLNNEVLALAVFDDGSGPALYAGGAFTSAIGGPRNHVARWTGSGWAAVGSGTATTVRTLTVFDDGSGPALYAAGSFFMVDGVAINAIARWDGASWSPLGAGLQPSGTSCSALAQFEDDGGPALVAGGQFTISPARDSFLAKWSVGRKIVGTH